MLITIGDIIDLYFQIRNNRKLKNLFNTLFLSRQKRTEEWWSQTSSIPNKWWHIPQIHKFWNKKISGNPDIPYIEYVKRKYLENKKEVTLLSLGCGTGKKELGIAKAFPHWQLTGLDLSTQRINSANETATKKGLNNIHFIAEDFNKFCFHEYMFDIILFDSSLHHFSELDSVFYKIGSLLKSTGLVLINEYVGPNRFHWTNEQLKTANIILDTIPAHFQKRWNSQWRKKRIYRPGYLRMLLSDPSEACCSSQILPSLHKHFRVIEEIPLGGNLIQLILNDIAHNFINNISEAPGILERLFTEEEKFLQSNNSDFVFGIYGRKDTL